VRPTPVFGRPPPPPPFDVIVSKTLSLPLFTVLPSSTFPAPPAPTVIEYDVAVAVKVPSR
jgi:hypothetical protein